LDRLNIQPVQLPLAGHENEERVYSFPSRHSPPELKDVLTYKGDRVKHSLTQPDLAT